MSVALAETMFRPTTTRERTAEPAAVPVRTRPRRPGPGVGPTARPRRLRFVPPPAPAAAPRACRAEPAPAVAAVAARPHRWRLTERGVAVVLVLAAALVAASVVVVGLTALRVTGEGYQSVHQEPMNVVGR